MKVIRPVISPELKAGHTISASEFARLNASHDVVDETRKWEQEKKAQLEQEAAQLRRDAQAKGLREGLSLFEEANLALQAKEAKLESDVTKIVEACLLRVFAEVPGSLLFEAILGDVFAASKVDGTITILCNSIDFEAVNAAVRALSETESSTLSSLEIQVEIQDELERSHCEIHTAEEIMCAGVSVLMTELLGALSLSNVTVDEKEKGGKEPVYGVKRLASSDFSARVNTVDTQTVETGAEASSEAIDE